MNTQINQKSEKELNSENYQKAKLKGGVFTVRLSAEDYLEFENKRDLTGKGKGELLRCLIRGIDVKARPTTPTREMIIQLNALGNNLNQIAAQVNLAHLRNKITDDSMAEVLNKLNELSNEINAIRVQL